MTLELQNVSCIYEKETPMQVKALENVNIKIEDKEFIGIIGHTGSGKSTLTQIMNGLITPTGGTVLIDGQDINAKKYSKRDVHKKIGYVFQYPENQLFDKDIISDVCFGPKNLGYSKDESIRFATNALSMVGIDQKYFNRSPFELSGGEKRRVAIAGVIAMNPDIFILDEPTAGLDPKSRDNLYECLQNLHNEHDKTIVIVSHSMEEVADYVKRIIVMYKGRVMYDDDKKTVFSKYKELEKIGLAAPEITYILNNVKEEGFDVNTSVLTIDEAVTEIMKGLGRHA